MTLQTFFRAWRLSRGSFITTGSRSLRNASVTIIEHLLFPTGVIWVMGDGDDCCWETESPTTKSPRHNTPTF
jgi:hypothetical protein